MLKLFVSLWFEGRIHPGYHARYHALDEVIGISLRGGGRSLKWRCLLASAAHRVRRNGPFALAWSLLWVISHFRRFIVIERTQMNIAFILSEMRLTQPFFINLFVITFLFGRIPHLWHGTRGPVILSLAWSSDFSIYFQCCSSTLASVRHLTWCQRWTLVSIAYYLRLLHALSVMNEVFLRNVLHFRLRLFLGWWL